MSTPDSGRRLRRYPFSSISWKTIGADLTLLTAPGCELSLLGFACIWKWEPGRVLPWPVFSRMFQLWTISDVLMINFYVSGSISLENVTLVGEKSIFFHSLSLSIAFLPFILAESYLFSIGGFIYRLSGSREEWNCLLLIVYSSINT